jgi:chromosome segregation ATPase
LRNPKRRFCYGTTPLWRVAADASARPDQYGPNRDRRQGSQLAAAAKAAARGQSVDIGALEEALVSTRQSVNDFKALCEYEAARAEKLTAVAAIATLKSKHDRLQKAMEAEDAKFAEVRDAFQARYRKLELEFREIDREVDAATAARNWLTDYRNAKGALGDQYREAVDAEQAARAVVDGINRRMGELRRNIKSADSDIAQLTASWEREITAPKVITVRRDGHPLSKRMPADMAEKVDTLDRRKKRLAAELTEVEKSLPAAEKAVVAAEAKVADFKKKQLTP